MSTLGVRNFMKSFIIPKEKYFEIEVELLEEMNHQLRSHIHDIFDNQDVKLHKTYVQSFPNGRECGKFLALDWLDNTITVVLIIVHGNFKIKIVQSRYVLPPSQTFTSAVMLFDYLALCLDTFIREKNLEDLEFLLGFTFPFPCEQKGLKDSILLRWTKDINYTGVVNQNVGRLLQEAINRRKNLQVKLVCVIYKTTALLIAGMHKNRFCRIGFIVDDDFNACYMECTKNVVSLEKEYKHKPFIAINIECSAFAESGSLSFILTGFDIELDKLSPNVGKQILGKCISGKYLGELARIMLTHAVYEGLIFTSPTKRDKVIKILNNSNCISTYHLCAADYDVPPDYTFTRQIVVGLFGEEENSKADIQNVHFIFHCIIKRSAVLTAICLGIMTKKVNEQTIVINGDGALFRMHANYKNYIVETMKHRLGDKFKITFHVIDDSGGRGAAFTAAAAVGAFGELNPVIYPTLEDYPLIRPTRSLNRIMRSTKSQNPIIRTTKSENQVIRTTVEENPVDPSTLEENPVHRSTVDEQLLFTLAERDV